MIDDFLGEDIQFLKEMLDKYTPRIVRVFLLDKTEGVTKWIKSHINDSNLIQLLLYFSKYSWVFNNDVFQILTQSVHRRKSDQCHETRDVLL